MSEVTRLVTADELERFPEDDYRYELVRGRLIRMSPVGWQHGGVVVHLISLLSRYLDEYPVGVIRTEVGFRLQSSPDTVRAPDVAFVRRDRVPAVERSGFVHGAPDLVVDVLSPEDRPGETREKVGEYLRAGVAVVVVVDPRKKSATVHRPSVVAVVLCGDDAVLDVGDPLPGFRCRLGDLFK